MYDFDNKNYKRIVRPEEDKDEEVNRELYYMKPDFQVIVLSNMSNQDFDDEIIQMMLDVLPC